MKIAEHISKTIDGFKTDHVFTCSDFNYEVNKKDAVVKALNRMVAAGKIAKFSKGKFYKPRQTPFGALKLSESQIIKDLLEKDGKTIGYITGYNAFNQMGLTTQIPVTIQIGTNKYRRKITRGSYKISFITQPNKISKSNIELLRILDAIRLIDKIPATTPDQAFIRLLYIIKELSVDKQKELVKLVLNYPPFVRTTCGAILEIIGTEKVLIEKIITSLNPVTEYKIPISDKVLQNKSKWKMK